MRTMPGSLPSSSDSGWSLSQLAARESPKEAAETYEQLFRLAIANNLFREAEPAAKHALKSAGDSPPVVQFLAQTIDVIASADRARTTNLYPTCAL